MSDDSEAEMKQARANEDFVTIEEFTTHAAKVLQRLNEIKRSIVITQYGKAAAVLVTKEEFGE